jgi:Tfp pilus assembly protein PilP
VKQLTGTNLIFSSFRAGLARKSLTLVLPLSLLVSAVGCRTTTEDVNRWASTVQGPRKLVAVLTHDKYPIDLRVEAALALIRMKPRNGRRVGIEGSDDQPGLMVSLAQMAPAERTLLVTRLVPALEAEIKKPPPVAQGGQVAADPSIPYKDAAFALLKHEGGRLIADEQLRKRLRDALSAWICVNFAQRFDDSTQMYSVKQMVGDLRSDAVRCLPNQMQPGAAKVESMAELVADYGDPATKLGASERLVTIATQTGSEAWILQKSPGVEAANKAAKLAPTPEQFRQQLEQYQEEELIRVFTSMKRVGGTPVVDYLLAFAQDTKQSPKKRAAAIAALQGHLDRNSGKHADAVLAVAAAQDTPDQVRDVALQRVGEFPRAVVVSRLYGLFESKTWKVRWVAAELVLRMSDTSQLPEFFEHIGKAQGMAMTEPLRYGQLIAEMKGPTKPVDAIGPFLGSSHPVAARLTALGYYYNRGTAADLGKLSHLSSDKAKTPTCAKDDKDCEWKCEVDADGKRETKDIETVGEFFDFCMKPAMEKRPAR